MYDRLLALETLKNIENSLCEVIEWSADIASADYFSYSPTGVMLLNAVCMKLLTIGEEIKGLNRRTGGKLLERYPTVPWKQIMGMRDIIAHHYFSIDTAVIFSIIKVDIPPLLTEIKQMTADLNR